jgi:DNA-binding NtrC family response regulator
VQIDVPPLRSRKDDIPQLVVEFVNEFCLREKKALTLADEVMDAFLNYSWPGNIRQLKNVIERAVVLTRGKRITLNELPEELHLESRSVTLNDLEGPEIQRSPCAARAMGTNRRPPGARHLEERSITSSR